MIFSCEKALLNAAVNVAGRAVSPKSSIPALEGILVEAAGNSVTFTGYNMETGIRTSIDAEVKEEGTLVLSARLFGDIVRSLPDDSVKVSSKDLMVNVTCGLSSFHILATDPAEFPELPQVEEGSALLLKQGSLKSMIAQTIFAVSDNESRPIHTGSLFDAEGDTLTMVAVDGYRLALRRESLDAPVAAPFSFVAPGAALKEAERICADSDQPAEVIQGKRHILFRMGSTILISRRLEGEFLNYKNTIPRENPIRVEAAKQAVQTAVERVSLIISEKLKSPLRCTFGENKLSITTKTAVGNAYDACPVAGDGRGLEIGFNHRYLLDAIRAAPADTLALELNTPTSPCLVLPAGEVKKDFLYMVLPVRLKAE